MRLKEFDIRKKILILLTPLILSSCSGLKYTKKDINLIDYVYTYTKILISPIKEEVNINKKKIILTTVSDVNSLDETTPFGRTITEQVSRVFLENGFQIIDVRIPGNKIFIEKKNGEFYLTRDISKLFKKINADYIFTGVYSVGHRNVYVNFKLIDPTNRSVVSSVDFKLPLTEDIKTLLELYRECL